MTFRINVFAGCLIAAWLAIASTAIYVHAQQPGQLGNPPTPVGVSSINGHAYFTGGNPVTSMTGGTVDDGSIDSQGAFVATAGSGTITFTVPYNRFPWCDVTAYVGAAPATYTVTAQAITISTMTSTDRYTWQCFARPGG